MLNFFLLFRNEACLTIFGTFSPSLQPGSSEDPSPKDSFAWKDNTLERELKSIRRKNQTQGKEGQDCINLFSILVQRNKFRESFLGECNRQLSSDIFSYFFEQTRLICFIAEVEGDDPFRRGGRPGGRPGDPSVDRRIDRSIGNWSSLPRAPDQEVILLKKARGEITIFFHRIKLFPNFLPVFSEERKVRRYLDDNFQNRPELVTPDEEIK